MVGYLLLPENQRKAQLNIPNIKNQVFEVNYSPKFPS